MGEITESQCRKCLRCCVENRNHGIVGDSDALWTREVVKQDCSDMRQLYPWPWPLNLSHNGALSFGRSVCLSVHWSSLWGCGVPEERKSDLPQLACLSMAYCQHPPEQQHCHLEHSPSRSLYCFLLCVHKDTFSFFIFLLHQHRHVRAQGHTQCIESSSLNHSGQQVFTDAHPNNWKAHSFVFV